MYVMCMYIVPETSVCFPEGYVVTHTVAIKMTASPVENGVFLFFSAIQQCIKKKKSAGVYRHSIIYLEPILQHMQGINSERRHVAAAGWE